MDTETSSEKKDQKEEKSDDEAIISDLITITVKTIDSKNYQFQVESDLQIKDLKERIAQTVEIEPDSQRMIFCGRVLSDNKTLKDYKIDNDKVIHLVKRTQVKTDNNDNKNNRNNRSNNNNNNNNNDSRTRFSFRRADDGSSFFMETFPMQMTQPNIIDQVLRRVFFSDSATQSASARGSDQSSEGAIRSRFNHIRQLLRYVETNFQILRNPVHFPTSQEVNAFGENHRITTEDYINCFQDTLQYFERLQPYLNRYLQALNESRNSSNQQQNNETQNILNNHSLLMRIAHHLSHVLHTFTDFAIDLNNPNRPVYVNVLENHQTQQSNNQNQNASNNNTTPAASSSSTNNTDSNNAQPQQQQNVDVSATTNNSNNNNSDGVVGNDDNQSGNASSATSMESGTPSATNSILNDLTANAWNGLRRPTSMANGSVFLAQSPILLMEVDATINGHRHGGRSMQNFSIQDLNVTINNLIHNANHVRMNPINLSGMANATMPTSTTSTTSSTTTTQNSSNQFGTSNNDNNGSSTSNQSSTTTTNPESQQAQPATGQNASSVASNPNGQNNQDSNSNSSSGTAASSNPSIHSIDPLQALQQRYDPFLSCNSVYTVPEIRSATNLDALQNLDSDQSGVAGIIRVSIPEPTEMGSMSTNALFSSLMNVISNLNNVESIENQEFYDFIEYLLRRVENLESASTPSTNNEQLRINDYLRTLNLLDTDDNNIISNTLESLTQNLDFQDLYQLINFSFQDYDRLRQPLQDLIRSNFLYNGERAGLDDESSGEESESITASVRRELNWILDSNQEMWNNVLASVRPLPQVDAMASLRNFLLESFTAFFDKIMQSNNDETFGSDLKEALKTLVISYLYFCRGAFEDVQTARNNLIKAFFDQYNSTVSPRLLSFVANIINERINSFSSTLELNDDSIPEMVQKCIVKVQGDEQQQQQPMESSSTSRSNNQEPGDQSNNIDDSIEEIEFADASSEMPTEIVETPAPPPPQPMQISPPGLHSRPSPASVSRPSMMHQQPPTTSASAWQAVVPNDWVPIIKEDINKQKNIDNEHKPPFSDAYLNGMSKKRRLEHEQQQQQQRHHQQDQQQDNKAKQSKQHK